MSNLINRGSTDINFSMLESHSRLQMSRRDEQKKKGRKVYY
jgi:hypothetical protein